MSEQPTSQQAVDFLKDADVIAAKPDPGTQYGVIRTDALTLSKNIRTLVAGAGGVSVVGGAVVTSITKLGEPVSTAAIASTGVVLAACAIALAWVLNGDARARSVVEREQIAARAALLKEFRLLLSATAVNGSTSANLVAPSSPTYLRKHREPQARRAVLAIRVDGEEMTVLTIATDATLEWVSTVDIEEIFVGN
jgi:hypothetical protein